MKTYIGTKIVKAEPALKCMFNVSKPFHLSTDDDMHSGYEVVYEDGGTSWLPKEVFEKAYHLAENMIVFKEDAIARKNADNTLTPYEVVCADENVFVIAPISLNDDDSCTTDYEKLEAYSNDKSIMTLEQMNFIKLEDK